MQPSVMPAIKSSPVKSFTAAKCISPFTRRSQRDERRVGLLRDYPPDFFDLVIVDECHRGSARDDSSWRAILDHFKPAYQLGMTATPMREDNRDTYVYFGNPIYEYSLRQGIDDGFLAPYRVHRVLTQWDAAGWRPSNEMSSTATAAQYPTMNTKPRISSASSPYAPAPHAIARHLTDFLKKTDRFAKTIVFCVDQEHAAEMREALVNLNADLWRSTRITWPASRPMRARLAVDTFPAFRMLRPRRRRS